MNLQPPPTYAEPVVVDGISGKFVFNPIWLNWFLTLGGVTSQLFNMKHSEVFTQSPITIGAGSSSLSSSQYDCKINDVFLGIWMASGVKGATAGNITLSGGLSGGTANFYGGQIIQEVAIGKTWRYSGISASVITAAGQNGFGLTASSAGSDSTNCTMQILTIHIGS